MKSRGAKMGRNGDFCDALRYGQEWRLLWKKRILFLIHTGTENGIFHMKNIICFILKWWIRWLIPWKKIKNINVFIWMGRPSCWKIIFRYGPKTVHACRSWSRMAELQSVHGMYCRMNFWQAASRMSETYRWVINLHRNLAESGQRSDTSRIPLEIWDRRRSF